MRAIVVEKFGALNDLLISDRSTELPKAGEVVVDVMTAAVNFADLLVIEGKYQFRPPLPFIPGKEAAGAIVALGDGVDGLVIGDRVMVQMEHGAFAERIVTLAKNCFLIPDKMTFEEAAAIGIAYQTAYMALVERAKIQAGETVLVTAASGSVGIAAIQLAKAMKCTVIAGLETMSKAPFVKGNGADHIVDLRGNDLHNSIRNQVKNCLVGDVDVIVEMIGGEVFHGAVRTLGWCGRLVVVGFAGGVIPMFKTNYALVKNITVTGVDRFSYLTHNSVALQRAQAEIFRLFVDGHIHLTIQAKYPMEQVVDAFNVIRDRKVLGKVVLWMNNE